MDEELIEVIDENDEELVEVEDEFFSIVKSQDKEVALNIAYGDQIVYPDGGFLLNSVTIEKPADAVSENIVEGANIGGILGSRHIDVRQTKTVEADFSGGDMVVTPDTGYDAMTSVTVEKPSTLIAENVKKDVNIAGKVGTLDPNSVIYSLFNKTIERVTPDMVQGWVSGTNLFSVGSLFGNSNALVEVSIPAEIRESDFRRSPNIEKVNFSALADALKGDYGYGWRSPFASRKASLYINGQLVEVIEIPNAVTMMERNTLAYLKSVRKIVAHDSVTSLGNECCYSMPDLRYVVLGTGITSIGSKTFAYNALTAFVCKAISPPTIQSDTFQYVPQTTVFYVPADSLMAYQTATNWAARASQMEAITSDVLAAVETW